MKFVKKLHIEIKIYVLSWWFDQFWKNKSLEKHGFCLTFKSIGICREKKIYNKKKKYEG
jgi:hypothetical protein